MATILEVADRWSSMKITTIRYLAMETLEELRQEYLDMQRDQMLHGETSKGGELNIIGLYKYADYADLKERMNPLAGGTVDLRYEGKFYKGLTLRARTEKIYEVYSMDWKNDLLVEKYGITIFLLNPNYLKLFRSRYYTIKLKQKLIDYLLGNR